jgi:hypothetical protein
MGGSKGMYMSTCGPEGGGMADVGVTSCIALPWRVWAELVTAGLLVSLPALAENRTVGGVNSAAR